MKRAEVGAAGEVALEDRVADVAAPDREALALALLEVAAAHDRPARVALEDSAGRLDLVVEVGEADEASERPEDLDLRPELPGVAVLAVERDVPAAREDEARARLGVVEHRLRRPRRVPVDTPRGEHHEHAVAPLDRPPDHVAVVRLAGDDRDPVPEVVELADALLPADADDLVAALERVPDHVAAELPGRADDADLHRARS